MSTRRPVWFLWTLSLVGAIATMVDDPSVVVIVEGEDASAVTPIRLAWDDLFDTAIFPVVMAEEGLEMLRQVMPAQ